MSYSHVIILAAMSVFVDVTNVKAKQCAVDSLNENVQKNLNERLKDLFGKLKDVHRSEQSFQTVQQVQPSAEETETQTNHRIENTLKERNHFDEGTRNPDSGPEKEMTKRKVQKSDKEAKSEESRTKQGAGKTERPATRDKGKKSRKGKTRDDETKHSGKRQRNGESSNKTSGRRSKNQSSQREENEYQSRDESSQLSQDSEVQGLMMNYSCTLKCAAIFYTAWHKEADPYFYRSFSNDDPMVVAGLILNELKEIPVIQILASGRATVEFGCRSTSKIKTVCAFYRGNPPSTKDVCCESGCYNVLYGK